MRVDRKNHWIHVCSSGEITLKFLHPKRAGKAIEAINIIPRYGGTIVHDCWASYLACETCDHGLCGSHLLRELTFIVESNGYRWAANMQRVLKQTCKLIAKRPSKQLDASEYKKLLKRYRSTLSRGAKERPPIPPKPKGKRGRVAKTDAHNLWERLKLHEKAVLLFAEVAHVPFTNPGRTRPENEQGQAEGLGLLPNTPGRRGLLPHSQLLTDDDQAWVESAGRDSDGPLWPNLCGDG